MADMSAFLNTTVELINGFTTEANRAAELVINAGNSQKLLHEYRDEAETTDEDVLKYRAAMDQVNFQVLAWQAKIEELILERGYVSTEPVDVEAKTAEYKALKAQITAAQKMLENLPGGSDVLSKVSELKPLPGVRASGTGGSTGTLRPRVAEVAVQAPGEAGFTALSGKGPKDKEGNVTHVSNFSTLAAHLAKVSGAKVEVSDLHKAAFEAAGTQDLSSLNGAPFSFSFTIGEVNYLIRITPSVKA